MIPSVDLRTDKGAVDYVLPCACENCGWSGKATLTKGFNRPMLPVDCPECGCRRVYVSKAPR